MTTTALISVQRSAQRADERVMCIVEREIPPVNDVVSPELALVDSRLAAGARERLPEVEVLALRPLPEPKALAEVLAATARRLGRLRFAPPQASPAPRSFPNESPPRGPLPAAYASATSVPLEVEASPGAALPPVDGSPAAARHKATQDLRRAPLPRLADSPPLTPLPTLTPPHLESPFETVQRAWGAPQHGAVPPADHVVVDAARRLADASVASQVERGPRRRQVVAGIAASFAAFATALLVADRALDRDTAPAAQASVALEQPDSTAESPREPTPPTVTEPEEQRSPLTTPQTQTPQSPPPQTPGSTAGLGPRTFAWAPVPNASGYHVELFRRGKRIFAVNTLRPNATVPASWGFEGRRYRLEATEYRWYVWPVVSGQRQARAVVQARLVVAPS